MISGETLGAGGINSQLRAKARPAATSRERRCGAALCSTTHCWTSRTPSPKRYSRCTGVHDSHPTFLVAFLYISTERLPLLRIESQRGSRSLVGRRLILKICLSAQQRRRHATGLLSSRHHRLHGADLPPAAHTAAGLIQSSGPERHGGAAHRIWPLHWPAQILQGTLHNNAGVLR